MGTKSVGGGEALVADIDGIRALDSRICGVVGQNFLSQFNYVLDYRGRRVVFEEEKAAPPSGMRLPIEQFEGRLLINTRLTSSSKGRPLRLILDSAATGIVIRRMPTPTSGLDIELTGNEWAKAATVAGVRMMRMARFKALGIGSETFFNLPVAVAQSGEEIESGAEDGLLPTSLFRSVYFNNREGYVILNPNFPE